MCCSEASAQWVLSVRRLYTKRMALVVERAVWPQWQPGKLMRCAVCPRPLSQLVVHRQRCARRRGCNAGGSTPACGCAATCACAVKERGDSRGAGAGGLRKHGEAAGGCPFEKLRQQRLKRAAGRARRGELQAGEFTVAVVGFAPSTQFRLDVELVLPARQLRPVAQIALGQARLARATRNDAHSICPPGECCILRPYSEALQAEAGQASPNRFGSG